jgi:CRP-like cAMP-binding protein
VEPTFPLWALGLGALASVSLPLGSAVGLALRPKLSCAALFAAFGAGAIIAALAVELVAPTVEEAAHGGHGVEAFAFLVAGAVAGGILFVTLDTLLASRGGFLRKASTAITWFTREQRAEQEAWLKDLCAIPLLRALPAERVSEMVRDVRAEPFAEGDRLFAEGDEADALWMVRTGTVDLYRGDEKIERIGKGGILGELPILAGLPRTVTAECASDGEALVLRRNNLERWRRECPEFDHGLRELAIERLAEIRERDAKMSEEEMRWGQAAITALRTGAVVPSPTQMRKAVDEHEGSPLAVWLGLLLDGVPESLVIGAGFMGMLTAQLAATGSVAFAEVVPYTLVAGVFLSNFPEAMSSSLGMRAQGWSVARVLGMWTLLLVLTSLATAAGFLMGQSVSHNGLVAIEGVAAGAALTAVVATMIPEAVHLAGSGRRVGLATLGGFLAAVSFKLLEA